MFVKSKFNYVVKNGDSFIIFNAYRNSIVLLDQSEYIYFVSNDSFFGESNFEQELSKSGLIIDEKIDEKLIVNRDRYIAALNRESATFRILTTSCCNARCFYCYEKDYATEKMDEPTMSKVVDFIISQTENVNSFSIQWFGGEPLLAHDVIDEITRRLDSYSREKNKEIRYTLVSNGILLDSNMIYRAINDWHIKKVQISLDGMEDEYESRKNYYLIENAFDKVIKNIQHAADLGLKISIRLNYDQNNIESIEKLIYYLHTKFSGNKLVSVYVYPLFDSINTSESFNSQYFRLNLLLNQWGFVDDFGLSNFEYVSSPCFACRSKGFTIMPNGDLGKCTQVIDKKEGFISKVNEFTGKERNYLSWINPEISAECDSCVFLPICQGGCKAGQLGYSNNICFIKRSTIDQFLIHTANKSSER